MKQKKQGSLKNILIGVCGSIAAYKVCDLIRMLKEKGFEIKCILTEAGKSFITPLTLQTLSKNQVYTGMFECGDEYNPEHISLAEWADIIVLAPASANTIAKVANGLADSLLPCVVLASDAPVLICPAMNDLMWVNPVTQKNVRHLKESGYHFIGPEKGVLASGKIGVGRLSTVDSITREIVKLIQTK